MSIRTSILFVVTEDWYFWSHRLSLGRAVRDAGFKVMVATSPGKLVRKIKDEGFEFYPLYLRRNSKNPLREILSIVQLTALYKSLCPDLVHHVALKPVIYGSIAGMLVNRPAIVNAITGLGYTFTGGSLRKKVLQGLFKLVSTFALSRRRSLTILQNSDDQGLLIKERILGNQKSRLIKGSGVDTDRFCISPEPSGEPVILLASRMIWDKGVGELVEAARILKQRRIKFKVILAGMTDPANPASIPETRLKEWTSEGIVQWVGHVVNMPLLLHSSHIVCLPSFYREGIPLALIEAASCGRPIVTTDRPGCREIVKHGLNGFLIPDRNAVTLADALEILIKDSHLRHKMGQEGRRMVLRDFSQEVVIQKTLCIYDELLTGKLA